MNEISFYLKLFPWIFFLFFIIINWKDFLSIISLVYKKQLGKVRKPSIFIFLLVLMAVPKALEFIPTIQLLKISEKLFQKLLIASEVLMLIMFLIWFVISMKKKPRIPFTKTFIHQGHPFDDYLLLSIWISLFVTCLSFFVVYPPINPWETDKYFEKMIIDESRNIADSANVVSVYTPISFERIGNIQRVKIFNNKKKVFGFVNFDYTNRKMISSIMPPGKYYACVFYPNEKEIAGVFGIYQSKLYKIINSESDSVMYVLRNNTYLPLEHIYGSHKYRVKSCNCSSYITHYVLFPKDMIIVGTTLKNVGTISQSSNLMNVTSILISALNNDTVYYSEMIQHPFHQIPVYLKEGDYNFSLVYNNSIKQDCKFDLSIINDTIMEEENSLIITDDRLINFSNTYYEYWENQIYVKEEN